MKTIRKQKKFDCLEMKTDIQKKILFETNGLNSIELLHYFNTVNSCPNDYTKWHEETEDTLRLEEFSGQAVQYDREHPFR
jgi:hypothetical protein